MAASIWKDAAEIPEQKENLHGEAAANPGGDFRSEIAPVEK